MDDADRVVVEFGGLDLEHGPSLLDLDPAEPERLRDRWWWERSCLDEL